jgi:hypothetical protein
MLCVMANVKPVQHRGLPISTWSAEYWAVPFTIALMAAAWRLRLGPHTIDDAYITFRYARNIAMGLGFVYNSGQHVIGTTTPTWTLVLAGLYWLGFHDLSSAAVVLGALLDGCTAYLLYRVAEHLEWKQPWPTFVAAAFAIAPVSLSYTAAGMETPLFTCCIVASCLALLYRRERTAVALAAVATLTRPEGALLALLLLSVPDIRKHFRPLIAWYAVPVGLWAVFAYLWSGQVLPQSMLAKSVAYGNQVVFRFNVASLLGPHTVPVLALCLAAPWGLRYLNDVWTRNPEARPVVLFAPCLVAAYLLASAHGVMLFGWYAAPLTPFVLLLVGAMFHRLNPGVGLAAIIVIVWTSVTGYQQVGTGREPAYIAMAEALNLPASTVVAAPEIGAFGYASKARMLDTVGLVSPVATGYYPLPPSYRNGSIPPALIHDQRPGYIVALDAFVPPTLTRSVWFRSEYREIRDVQDPVPEFGAGRLVVYESYSRIQSANRGLFINK